MDIRNVGTNGNIDRTGERNKGAQPRADVLIPFVAKDDARISDTGRKTAATADRLAERARGDDSDRAGKVEAARQRLLSGELDSPAVFAATAQKLAGRGFLSV